MQSAQQIKDIYEKRFSNLEKFALRLEEELTSAFADVDHVDRISVRAKSVESFCKKAAKLNESGQLKYQDPLSDIQDQIGARIIMFYRSDLINGEQVVRNNFTSLERQEKSPSRMDQFGYEGWHYIAYVPADLRSLVSTLEVDIEVFELQIRTLYQHAWSEASHDIAWKAQGSLSGEQERYIAFAAAQSWGADEIFDKVIVSGTLPNN